jgi:hypothetical protein
VSITGTVEKDTIKLPPGVHLPDGTSVRVELLPAPSDKGPGESFAERYAEFIGSIQGDRPDLSENLDHYLYGTPKRKP